MRHSKAAWLTAISCISAATFLAAPAKAAVVEATAGDDIVVIGEAEARVSTATKTITPLKDVPQAVSIVTSADIADQGMRSIADVLRSVPGAFAAQGEGHRDQIILRGNSSTADFFVNGLRDDVQYYRGLYNLDRVEVLKGPNALIFGRGGAGGIVNRVTKRPIEGRFISGAVSGDSEAGWYAEGDVNGPLRALLVGRLNAVYERFDNFRNVYEGHRIGINPTVALELGPDTRVDAGLEYARDHRVIDRGVPADIRGRSAATIDNPARPLDGFDEIFFGDAKLNRSRFSAKVATLQADHRFSRNVRLTSKLLYGDYDKLYQNAFAAGPATIGGGVETVAVEAYRDPTSRKNLLIQNDLLVDVATGPLRHTLLVGADGAIQKTRNQRINGFFDSGIPTTSGGRRTNVLLRDPNDIPLITFRAGPGNRSVRSHATVLGLYVQDQIKLGEHFEIVAGLRRDWFDLEVDNLLSGATFKRKDGLWSPRLGLVAKPNSNLSFYASFSRSFLPQSGDQFNSLDLTLESLKPERFTNLEIGAKWRALRRLDVMLAFYRLTRTNTREVDPLTLQTVLTGEQRSRGIELEINGDLTKRLSVSGGLAIQDVEIRKSAIASLVGREAPLVPHVQATLWGRYDFSDRIGAGLGIYHRSKIFASISNAVILPGLTRLDAAAYIALIRKLELQFNLENLLNEDYFATAHNDNNLSPGSPRTIKAALRVKL